MSMMDTFQFVSQFRQAGPYINAHRHKTFVISLSGEAIADEHFSTLIHDVALLHSLGIRLVLVHGARPQIEAALQQSGHELRYVNGLRVTDSHAMLTVTQAVGQVRIRIESLLSMGLANSPMHGAHLRVASGNFVTARPVGVRQGVDYGFTGEVRRIDSAAIKTALQNHAIILLSPLGYSPTGEVFNINAEAVALATAIALQADKWLILEESIVFNTSYIRALRQLSLSDVEQRLKQTPVLLPDSLQRQFDHALQACRAGVRRVHLMDRTINGALLLELFTRDGIGILITADLYEGLRPATIDDVGGILALIRPLEADGTLVRRSRERLEMEIDQFVVIERDGAMIGCAALYPFTEEAIGELACVAIHPDYRNSGRADGLLHFIERQAQQQGLRRLFVLTTHTAHWFQESVFEPSELADLPVQKQALYNFQRRSKVFIKTV